QTGRSSYSAIQFSGTRVNAARPDEGITGAVLSKQAEANGRPVSYVLIGEDAAGLTDGRVLSVTTALVRKTLNYWLLDTGWAYYTVFTSTPNEHRVVLARVAAAARNKGLNVWGRTPPATSNWMTRVR